MEIYFKETLIVLAFTFSALSRRFCRLYVYLCEPFIKLPIFASLQFRELLRDYETRLKESYLQRRRNVFVKPNQLAFLDATELSNNCRFLLTREKSEHLQSNGRCVDLTSGKFKFLRRFCVFAIVWSMHLNLRLHISIPRSRILRDLVSIFIGYSLIYA